MGGNGDPFWAFGSPFLFTLPLITVAGRPALSSINDSSFWPLSSFVTLSPIHLLSVSNYYLCTKRIEPGLLKILSPILLKVLDLFVGPDWKWYYICRCEGCDRRGGAQIPSLESTSKEVKVGLREGTSILWIFFFVPTSSSSSVSDTNHPLLPLQSTHSLLTPSGETATLSRRDFDKRCVQNLTRREAPSLDSKIAFFISFHLWFHDLFFGLDLQIRLWVK